MIGPTARNPARNYRAWQFGRRKAEAIVTVRTRRSHDIISAGDGRRRPLSPSCIPMPSWSEPLPDPASDSGIPGLTAPLRVAFQGEPGAFSEEAIHQLWGAVAEPVPMRTYEAVMEAAETGEVDFGLLPIESTLVGGVESAYDLLALHDGLRIAREAVLPVRLALLGLPGAKLADLRTVASHPLLLGQCVHFLARYRHIQPEMAWDTAAAAREVAERGDPTRAAAGSRRAAERYGLSVLAKSIEDRPDAQMRFLAVGREPAPLQPDQPARTAVLCVFPNTAGALISALQPIANAGYNISHLAARPTREPWTYQYFLEFEHPALASEAGGVIDSLRRGCAEARVLGTYPRWRPESSSGS